MKEHNKKALKMELLLKAIKSVFEDFDEKEFNENLEMSEIPGWDSMNSVNLQLEIESVFGIDFSKFIIGGNHKISDIIENIKSGSTKDKN